MKKILFVLGVVAIAAGMTSCKKDCVCTATDANNQVIDAYTYENLTLSECEDKVDEATEKITEFGAAAVGMSISCTH